MHQIIIIMINSHTHFFLLFLFFFIIFTSKMNKDPKPTLVQIKIDAIFGSRSDFPKINKISFCEKNGDEFIKREKKEGEKDVVLFVFMMNFLSELLKTGPVVAVTEYKDFMNLIYKYGKHSFKVIQTLTIFDSVEKAEC